MDELQHQLIKKIPSADAEGMSLVVTLSAELETF